MENLKENLFKIRKMIIERRNGEKEEVAGVLIPTYYYNSGDLVKNRHHFISIEAGCIEVELLGVKSVTFKTTKIVKPEVKEALNELIKKEKERYKIACQIQALHEKIKPIREGSNQIIQTLPSLSGLLTESDFFALLHQGIPSNSKGFRLKGTVGYGKLRNLRLEKEVELGKYVCDGEFSFAYEEYDGNLMLWDDYQNDEQYQALIKQHFTPFKKEKVGAWTVKEYFAAETGDKRTLGIYQGLILTPKKELPLTEETVQAIIPVLTSILKSL